MPELDKINYDSIVVYYVYMYLYLITKDTYYNDLCIKNAYNSLKIFRYSLDWELEKVSKSFLPKEFIPLTDNNILNYISAYPEHLHESSEFLGKKWYNIAKLILGANDDNIIQIIDKLVDMDHNNGNVLCRIILDYDRYKEFITVKSYNTNIRELILFSKNFKLNRDVYRYAKQYDGQTKESFENNYMKLLNNKYCQMKINPSIKKQDIDNVERLIEQCHKFDSSVVLDMIASDTYAWTGKLKTEIINSESIYKSILVSGKYENCHFLDSKIESGYFVNCIFTNCSFTSCSVLKKCVLISCNLLDRAHCTIISCTLDDSTVVYSDDNTYIDMEVPSIKITS